ncbi:MAG: Imm49 family immunity protein [Bacteroidota bacterium]
MDEAVERGHSAIWCNTIQHFMGNNQAGLEKNLNILETKTLKNVSKKEMSLKYDYIFFRSLYEKDKSGAEAILEKMTTPPIHKLRNDNSVFSQHLSLPALGYAKLAWLTGVEINVASPLIPKELLPIKPLVSYDMPFEFLKTV